MKTLNINLKDKNYKILIGKGLRNKIKNILDENFKFKKVAIITDENVYKIYGKEIKQQLLSGNKKVEFIILKPGEKTKSFNILPEVYNKLLDFKITRSDLIIALGGGVIGDLAGFVSATFLRGIKFIQIPTTLLAQVDSSVGGKVAVDLDKGKNLVGAFYHPELVIIDVDVLNSLDNRVFYDGMAEVIKYGCIRDEKLFNTLMNFNCKNDLMNSMEDIIYTCCDIKRQFVENDEKDTGERMILNFGHTIGHAIEKYYNYEKYTHGESVAIGMYLITKLSEYKGYTDINESNKIKKILIKYNLPCDINLEKFDDLLETISLDKKNLDNVLNLILLNKIGDAKIVKSSLEFFQEVK